MLWEYSSITIKITIAISDSIHKGKAINNWVNISGGDNKAQTIKHTIINSFLLPIKLVTSIMFKYKQIKTF
jgi:hypothetical protein